MNKISDLFPHSFSIFSGSFPFYGTNQLETANAILFKELNFESRYLSHVSKDCVDLLQKLLEKDPEKRPTAEDVLNHPWINDEVPCHNFSLEKIISPNHQIEKSSNFSKSVQDLEEMYNFPLLRQRRKLRATLGLLNTSKC